ncbi:MAG: hypothetical protein JO313_15815 [Verrucomicrobia bacterium]|nr:hypothetical protein [Verrucomicrobiota bacterium]
MIYKGVRFEVTKTENPSALPRPHGQNAWTWKARVFGEVLTATLIAKTEPEVIESVIRFIDNNGFSAEHLIDSSDLTLKGASTKSVVVRTVRGNPEKGRENEG